MSIASAWVGFTLPGMIELPGLVGGKISSPNPVRGPEPSQRRSLAILNKLTAAALSAGVRAHHPVQRALRGELVRRGHVRPCRSSARSGPRPGPRTRPGRSARCRPRCRPSPAPAARSWRARPRRSRHPAPRRSPDHSWPTVSGTASSRCVRPILTTSAHCLDLASMASRSRFSAGIVLLRGHRVRGDVHRGRERVVGRLAHVHVIVGMHRLLGAQRAADQLDAPVGDHLVDVHVRLGARAGLPHVQRELRHPALR